MSEYNNVDTQNVSKIVDGLLKQNLHLSVEFVDTYYLYGSDKQSILTLNRTANPGTEIVYDVSLNCTEKPVKLKLDQDVYKNLYKQVHNQYNFEAIPHAKTKPEMTALDVRKMWNDKRAWLSVKNKEKFLYDLIKLLIENRMPVDVINRVFYYFDKPKSKHAFPANFVSLNHGTRLVKYHSPRGKIWFFSDGENTVPFKVMDKESQKIFDAVKIALQKQKQNVK